MAKKQDSTDDALEVNDQAAADQAAADQAAADQAAADQAAADQAAGMVEAVLLRDSNLGSTGDVVEIASTDVAAYSAHGMVDVNQAAIDYAKSQKQ